MTEPQGAEFFSFAGRFRLMQVLEIRTLGTPDPMDCKMFHQRQVFIMPRFRFKTGFTYIKSAQEWKADEDISAYKGKQQNDGEMTWLNECCIVCLQSGCWIIPGGKAAVRSVNYFPHLAPRLKRE
jgi:hypothetical protein